MWGAPSSPGWRQVNAELLAFFAEVSVDTFVQSTGPAATDEMFPHPA
jgi:hypothetical protein